MKKFDELTKYLPLLEIESFGTWVFDEKNDGTPEHPIQMPYIRYAPVVYEFIHSLYGFCSSHPEYEYTEYNQTLETKGISGNGKDPSEFDVSNADAKCIIALLVGATRAERFCEGALEGVLSDGSIHRWLERLKELDT